MSRRVSGRPSRIVQQLRAIATRAHKRTQAFQWKLENSRCLPISLP